MELELRGRVALVTGGSRGIGKSVAQGLAFEGVRVAVAARGRELLEAAAAELRAETKSLVLAIPADTGKSASVDRLVQQTVAAFGGLDILVNCAAEPDRHTPTATVDQVTSERFQALMNVKGLGYLRCARAAAPYMTRAGWGRIINVSGYSARQTGSILGSIRNVVVVALTKNLADELGPHGINVTAVMPGATRTDDRVTDEATRLGISLQEAETQLAQRNFVRKLIEPRDVARVVTFLASPKSVAITGEVIAVAGGWGPGIYY